MHTLKRPAILSEVGSNPNKADKDGVTPFMRAAAAGELQSLEIFLKNKKIEINKTTDTGRTALDKAVGRYKKEALMQAGAMTGNQLELKKAFNNLIASLDKLNTLL